MKDSFKWPAIMLIGVTAFCVLGSIFSDDPATINARMRLEAVSMGYGEFQEGEFVWKKKDQICKEK